MAREEHTTSQRSSLWESVPPVMLGNSPEPRSVMERGSLLIAQSESFGIDPLSLCNPDVDFVFAYHLRRRLGV